MTKISIVEPAPAPPPLQTQKKQTTTDYFKPDISEHDSLETKILKVVKNDPFTTISEIRDEVNIHSNFNKTSWWQVFKILKNNALLTRKSRFRYVRGYL